MMRHELSWLLPRPCPTCGLQTGCRHIGEGQVTNERPFARAVSALLGQDPTRPQHVSATVAAVPALASAAAGGAESLSADAVALLLAVSDQHWLTETRDFFSGAVTEFEPASAIVRAIDAELGSRELLRRVLHRAEARS